MLIDDKTLVQRWRSADQAAFQILFERHHRFLMAVTGAFLDYHEDREKVAETTWKKAAGRVIYFHPELDDFRAWITAIALEVVMEILSQMPAKRRRPVVARLDRLATKAEQEATKRL